MRIDKLLSNSGFGSRKEVKLLLKGKAVEVNGVTVRDPKFHVDEKTDEVSVAGEPVVYREFIYLMMNKPQGVISATEDRFDETVIDLLTEDEQRFEPFPVGRLDKDTEGLLLITDNGQLGYQLLLPHKKVTKRYEVVVNERVTVADQEAFAEGIVFHGGTTCKPARLTILSHGDDESRVLLDISEGKFHQVKKMFLSVGKKVTYLKRLTMGPIELDESIPPGSYRPLNEAELEQLKPYFR